LPAYPFCKAEFAIRKRFRYSASAEYQNRKIFVFLIEKISRGITKKCLENFSVLPAVAKRRRAETLDKI